MKKILLYSLILLSFLRPELMLARKRHAKAKAYYRVAELKYKDLQFLYAIPFYTSSLQYRLKKDSAAIFHLADCYWQIKLYDSAYVYYRNFEQKYGMQFLSSSRLAEILASRQKYPEAAKTYQLIKDHYPTLFTAEMNARLRGFLDIWPFFKDSASYSIKLLKLNTPQQDFSPQYYQDGFVFVSNRYTRSKRENAFGWDGLPFANIYLVRDTANLSVLDTLPARVVSYTSQPLKVSDDYTPQTSNDNNLLVVSSRHPNMAKDLHPLELFTGDIHSAYNYGPLCFNKNGDKVYFTRNSLKPYQKKYSLEICEAELKKGVWGKIAVMPFVQPAYDFFHPALSTDESRLYFCSNKPGGRGGSDIYYISLATASTKSLPIALDSTINTAGNELFPTISGDTLFFSSDGLAGLGGLDIFRTSEENNAWKTPVNMGYPINSPYDDFGIIFNKEKKGGLFTSNRLGSDDLFKFESKLQMVKLHGTVANKTSERYLAGVKVMISCTDLEKPYKDSLITDSAGNFTFPVIVSRHYQLIFSKEGFTEDSIITTVTQASQNWELPSIALLPVIKALPEAVIKERMLVQKRLNDLAKMLHFRTASAELSPAALKPLNEAVKIFLQYPNTTLVIEGHTDSVGREAYNKDLSQRRANTLQSYLVSRGIGPERFVSVIGYGSEKPVADNKTKEGRALNRRVSIKITFIN